MTTNELFTLSIAAYAAIISTFVLGWDAYKWLDSGPKIRLSASTDMIIVGGNLPNPKTYISVTAVNLGDRATTLTNLGFLYYDSWFKSFRQNKADKAFIIGSPSQSQVIPYRFEAGAQWIGLADQDDDFIKLIGEGYLFVILYHSHSGKGARYRLTAKHLAKHR